MIQEFISNSKNIRKALNILKSTWKRLGALVFEKAAEDGFLDIVKWLRSTNPTCKWDETTSAKAAENGHFDIVEYCHENGCKWDSQTPQLAATNRHFDIVIYCLLNHCPWNDSIVLRETIRKILEFINSIKTTSSF